MVINSVSINEIMPKERLPELLDGVSTIGIDIGSRQSKAVLIHDNQLYTVISASGVDSQETAERLIARLVKGAEIERSEISWIVGTGYGRVAMQFQDIPSGVMTEITCHALGAHFLNAGTRTIIDIGGQDCKAIKIDPENGHVIEFVMNDKCAAGTGRFLEKTAEMLGYSLEELGDRVLESKKKLEISSQCVVFAESEIISLKARGEKREDIAAGIHFAAARRVKNLVKRIGLDPELVFSGGVSNNLGMKHALEDLLKNPIKTTALDTVYCGALGAAVLAKRAFRDSSIAKES
ncbi:MAG: acyl-CoA dehydratase activase [Bacillota bacterium]|nr:acyl-CoA dehydratase activase [Bacillota bacterium]